MALYLELITPPSPQKCEPPSPFYLPPDSNTNQFCSRVPRSPSGWWRVPGHHSPMPGWRGSPGAGTGGHNQMSVDWGDPGGAETVTSVTTHNVRQISVTTAEQMLVTVWTRAKKKWELSQIKVNTTPGRRKFSFRETEKSNKCNNIFPKCKKGEHFNIPLTARNETGARAINISSRSNIWMKRVWDQKC